MSDKKYSDEFKRDVLAMAEEGSRSVAQLERDLGITAGRVYKWRVGKHRVARLMRQMGLQTRGQRRFRVNHAAC